MLKYVRLYLLSAIATISLSGCAAVLVGGLIYDHTESRKECQELLKDPDFAEKMKIPEYEENYRRVCGIDDDEDEDENVEEDTLVEPTTYSIGSGFSVSAQGQILTSSHAIDDCHQLRVALANGTVTATVGARDEENGLALLETHVTGGSIATFRTGRGVRAGDEIVVVGFPMRGTLTSASDVTTGSISALAGPGNDTRILQITAPVQSGNSGGPLLDRSGNVVGMAFAKIDAIEFASLTGEIPGNVNLALNARVIQNFLDASGVDYETAPSELNLETAEIGSQARNFTVPIECID